MMMTGCLESGGTYQPTLETSTQSFCNSHLSPTMNSESLLLMKLELVVPAVHQHASRQVEHVSLMLMKSVFLQVKVKAFNYYL